MDFGEALIELKGGRNVGRKGWNGKEMSIFLCVPVGGGTVTLPFIAIKYGVYARPDLYPDGMCVPWVASQTDMLANDWQLIIPGERFKLT